MRIGEKEIMELLAQYNNADNKQDVYEKFYLLEKDFISYIARKHFLSFQKEYEDLCTEGAIALLETIQSYNKEVKLFQNVLYTNILAKMYDYIYREVFHTSKHYALQMMKVKKAICSIEADGRQLSVSVIAKESHISEYTVKTVLTIMKHNADTPYDLPYETEEQQCYAVPEDTCLKKAYYTELLFRINELPADSAYIIKQKYFFDQSIKSIASVLHLPEHRVRRAEKEALSFLRKKIA